MEKKKYKRLTLRERIIIETLLEENCNKSLIAQRLNRTRSTISREINKWIKNRGDTYKAELAHWYAVDENNNKRFYDKLTQFPRLKIYVYRGLLRDWSPELIAGKLKIEYPNDPIMSISHETIYKHIYMHPQGRLNKKLISLLVYHKSRRRSIKGSRKHKGKIKDAVSIDNRPKHIEQRKEIGHWEGDLIIGAKQASAIGTQVERKTRFLYIVKPKDRKSKTVVNAFAKEMNQLPTIFRKSLYTTVNLFFKRGRSILSSSEITCSK